MCLVWPCNDLENEVVVQISNSFKLFVYFRQQDMFIWNLYGIMTEELVISEIRIDEAAGQGNSD